MPDLRSDPNNVSKSCAAHPAAKGKQVLIAYRHPSCCNRAAVKVGSRFFQKVHRLHSEWLPPTQCISEHFFIGELQHAARGDAAGQPRDLDRQFGQQVGDV